MKTFDVVCHVMRPPGQMPEGGQRAARGRQARDRRSSGAGQAQLARCAKVPIHKGAGHAQDNTKTGVMTMVSVKQTASLVDAFIHLLARRGWSGFDVVDLARESGLSLAQLRRHFPTRLDCLAACFERLDTQMLQARDTGDADDPPRERLAEQLLARIDAMEPARPAMAQLLKAVRRDPLLAMQVNRLAVRSQGWILARAGIRLPGVAGHIVAQGLTLEFVRVLEIWLNDESEDRMRTLAALDKGLRRGEKNLQRLCRLKKRAAPLCRAWAAMTGTGDRADAPRPPAGAAGSARAENA